MRMLIFTSKQLDIGCIGVLKTIKKHIQLSPKYIIEIYSKINIPYIYN